MSQELQLGKYEFIPYEDKRENAEDILEELKKLLPSDEEGERHRKDILEKFIKRKKKSMKK